MIVKSSVAQSSRLDVAIDVALQVLKTAGSATEPEKGLAHDAPSGPASLPGDGQTAGSEEEPDSTPARKVLSGPVPLPG
jgi:hypothetical protein